MPCRGRLSVFGSITVLLLSAGAQDASFGCKVLLCVAATAPGWSGIPYCVPVMEQLFSDLRRGGGWPTCAEATAGSSGPNQNCPNAMAVDGDQCANKTGE